MERPAKRLRVSENVQRRCRRRVPWQLETADCWNSDGHSTNVISGNPSVPVATPTPITFSTPTPGPRGQLFTQLPPQFGRRDAVELRPRVPDTTVLATAVDVNVQSGSSTIANTILIQVSDATVVSFTSVGVLTVSAPTTTTATPSPASVVTDASGSTISPSPSSSPLSDSTVTATESVIPTLSALSGLNSSVTSTTSDRIVTMTMTSTLDIAFVNGTVITLSNPPNSASASSTLANTTLGASEALTSSDLVASTLDSSTGILSTANSGAGATSTSVAAGAGSPASPSASATSTSSSNSGEGPVASTPQVVGGVVGGVAGLALALLLVLFILRWWRRRMRARGELPEQVAARSTTSGAGGSGTANQVSQRSSRTPLTAALLSSTRRWRPQSSGTTITAATAMTASTEPERGFQRIAGRKIAPVIGSGGDQYGGSYGAFETPESAALPEPVPGAAAADAGTATTSSRDFSSTQGDGRDLAGSSFYRDSRGFYGGQGDSAPPTSTVASSTTVRPEATARHLASSETVGEESADIPAPEPEGIAVIRPSPARTPVTSSPSASSIRLPIQQNLEIGADAPPTPALPTHLSVGHRARDGVGRSHGSQDGSRSSRFTEIV